jgi:hypothetical protein
MSTPQLIVHLAFGDDPLTPNASASWEDVSGYVSGNDEHMTHRGRNHERDENEAGTAIVVLRNTDRRFDPNNSSGPYLGDIKPMVKIRIGALWPSGTLDIYWMFHGYVESWHPDYTGGSVSTCTLECVDAFKYFGLADVHTPANRPAEDSDDRISYILDSWVFWPASERNIAAIGIPLAEMPLDGSALRLIQDRTRAERGSFFISKFGSFTFEDRSRRDTATPEDVWGDAADGSELPYSSVSIRYDDSDIFNRIEVTRAGGIKQTMNDVASQGDYFIRTFSSTGLPYASDADALTAAETMLHRYKGARTRLDRMVIDPGVRDTWIPVLSRELSEMITVKRSTLVDGHTTTLDGHIEAITWHITKGLWECTWQLSPHFAAPTLGSGTLNTTDDWKVPTLLNSWVDFGGANPPAGYRKEGDWIALRGLVKNGTLTSPILQLPVGYRPPFPMRFAVPSGTATAQAYAAINGDVGLVSGTGGSSTSVDLGPIRFRVN